jgi:hypothetical protein
MNYMLSIGDWEGETRENGGLGEDPPGSTMTY